MFCLEQIVLDQSDTESVDSIRNSFQSGKKTNKKSKKTHLSTNDEDDDDYDYEEGMNEKTRSVIDEDEENNHLSRSKLKKIKESSKKCRLFLQVIRKRRECNSNYDSANDDYEVIFMILSILSQRVQALLINLNLFNKL